MSKANPSIISHFIPLDFQVQFICKVIIRITLAPQVLFHATPMIRAVKFL